MSKEKPTVNVKQVNEHQPYSIIRVLESFPRLLTVDDLAAILGLSPTTIYRMAQRKQIPSLIIGGSRRFDPAAIGMHFRKKAPESAAAARSQVAGQGAGLNLSA